MLNERLARLFKILRGAEGELLPWRGRSERWLHFWVLVGRQFSRNRCPGRAQSLSYSSLLALIPLLAVALGVSSSLLKNQDEERIYHLVDQFVACITPPAGLEPHSGAALTNTPALADLGTNGVDGTVTGTNSMAATNSVTATNSVVAAAPPADSAQVEIARQIRNFVQNTNSGTLGVTGMILLVLAAILMLRSVETTFNDIWGVTEGRPWVRQVMLFCTVIMLGPPLLITAFGMAGEGQVQGARELVAQMPLVGGLVFKFLPLAMLWLTFALIYWAVPNTRVKFSSAFVGGLAGGTLWQLNNWGGFLFVSRVATNRTIYGSLGLVPVLMIGLYFSWCILLFGAQVAYVFQNRFDYWQDRLAGTVNQRGREFVALRVMAALGRRFQAGGSPATAAELSAGLGVPGRLTEAVLRILSQARLVTEVAGAEPGYVPARPLEGINVYDILHALRTANGQELPPGDAEELQAIYGEFARVEQAERETASHISLHSLVERTSARLPAVVTPRLPEPVIVNEAPMVEEKVETPVPESVAKSERPAVVQPEEREFPL